MSCSTQKIALVPATTETGDQTFDAVALPEGWRIARVVLSVTSAPSLGSLWSWLQESHDGGTTWHDVAQMIRLDGSAPDFECVLQLTQGGINDDPTRQLESKQLAEGTVYKVGWPDQLRVVTTQTKATADFSVIAHLEFG